jgi:hypothetical protein
LPATSPRASISAFGHVESVPAELDRPTVGKKLAAMRQHPETSERDARWCFGVGIHRYSGPPQEPQASSQQAGARATGLQWSERGRKSHSQRQG